MSLLELNAQASILDIVNSTLYTTVTGSAFGKTLTFTRDQPYFPLTSDGSVRAYLDDAERLFEPLGNSRLGLKFERTEITVKLPTQAEATALGATSICESLSLSLSLSLLRELAC